MRSLERVVVYGSLGLRRGVSDLLWAFRKSSRLEEFPAYLDDHPFQVMQRIRSEMKGGLNTADIVLMPHYAVTSMGKEGLLITPGMTQSAVDVPANLRGSDKFAVPVGTTFMAMAYNTKRVRPQDLPTGPSDLTSRRWKNKLGTQSLTSSRSGNLGAWYMSYLKRRMTSREWTGLTESLGNDNSPRAYDCIDHLLQGLLEGEVDLALTVYSLAYFREKLGGSPIALVDGNSIPHMMTFTSAALVKGSKSNPSAKKFLRFLLTPRAQEIIGSIPGIASVDPSVKEKYDFEHHVDESTEFHPTPKDFKDLGQNLELFRTLKLP
ncbi:MAG TPA: extracellular solute-binding protein [Nitrososphaerales archaeon]|nr:extracellular solute-binding protein [Nitrososphaerales archaeon]